MYALVSARHRHDGLGCSAVLLGREVPTYRTSYLRIYLRLPGTCSPVGPFYAGEDVESTSGGIHISSGTTSYWSLLFRPSFFHSHGGMQIY